MSSARPPRITTLVSPSAVSPAVRAKGTVRPSESPKIASETILTFRWKLQNDQGHVRCCWCCGCLSEVNLKAVVLVVLVELLDKSGRLASRSGAVGNVSLSSDDDSVRLDIFLCRAARSMITLQEYICEQPEKIYEPLVKEVVEIPTGGIPFAHFKFNTGIG